MPLDANLSSHIQANIRAARDDGGVCLRVFWDQLCGEVEVAHVFIQRGADVGLDVGGEVCVERHVGSFSYRTM